MAKSLGTFRVIDSGVETYVNSMFLALDIRVLTYGGQACLSDHGRSNGELVTFNDFTLQTQDVSQ